MNHTATSMSLYDIEVDLMNLLLAREALVENDDDLSDGEQKEALANVDYQIKERISSDLRLNKIDGVAFYLREFQMRAEAADEEIDRLKERKRMWENRHDRFEAYVKGVMLATGHLRLDGRANTLTLRKNPPSVEIERPELVPDEYQKITVSFPLDVWKRFCALEPSFDLVGKREIMKTPILQQLKAKRDVPGCTLITDKMNLRVE